MSESTPDVLAALTRLVDDVDALIANSGGVYGLHLNGDPAPWTEIGEDGSNDGWLGQALAAARAAITEAKASANLIASAPDLLAALRGLLGMIAHAPTSGQYIITWPLNQDGVTPSGGAVSMDCSEAYRRVAAARAAIAKAEGRS